MTETNVEMDERLHITSFGEGEMSVDGPPHDLGESTVLQGPSENKTIYAVEKVLQHRLDKKVINSQDHGCSEDKVQESPCDFGTEPQAQDPSTDKVEDKDDDHFYEVKPSKNTFQEDVRNDAQEQPNSCTIKDEVMFVSCNEGKTEAESRSCLQSVAFAAEPKVVSKERDGNSSKCNVSGINSPESKLTNASEHISTQQKDKISTTTEELATKFNPEDEHQDKMAPPNHLQNTKDHTLPMSSVTHNNVVKTPNSCQHNPTTILQKRPSLTLKGNAGDNNTAAEPTTDKDQLYPLRKMQEEKSLERPTHPQANDSAISNEGPHKNQKNAKEHTAERSITGPKEGSTTTPGTKTDESKEEPVAQNQMPQIESSTVKQPAIHEDVPLEGIRRDAIDVCHKEKMVEETVQPNLVNVVSVTPEEIKTPPPNNTGIKTQSQSPEKQTFVPKEQVLKEQQIEMATDLNKAGNIAHQPTLQEESVIQNMQDYISFYHLMVTGAALHGPEKSLVKEDVHLEHVHAPVTPEDIKTSPPCPVGNTAQSQSPKNKSDIPREQALTEPQMEKTLEDGHEATLNLDTADRSKEPNNNSNAESSTETQAHQGLNSSALEVNYHQENNAVAMETKTVSNAQETIPGDDLQEQQQNTQPMGTQPLYSEPPDDSEHLYVEADDIHLMEDPILRQQVSRLDHVTLNIAVTGMTGAGKSTFINAIRGIDNDDEKAAPTGVTETSMDVCRYPHPSMPNVNLWDLPGTGSPKFKAKKYLKYVKFESYDFFIIISSERFKENDIMLAKAILDKKKKFYFLRSKIDNEVRAEECKKNFDEEKMLDCIRQDCVNHLKKIVQPTVFLICSFELNKYDFPSLVDTLTRDLPEHKKDALTLSLPVYSTEVLEKKIKTLTQTAQSAAKAASAISVAPVPGLAMACDAGILLGFFSKCYYAFGLDNKSLDKLSERVNNHSLKAVRESRPLVMALQRKELSGRELSALGSKRSAIEFAYSLVPIWGSKKAANMSHESTLSLLSQGLKELADTARDVLKAAKIDHI